MNPFLDLKEISFVVFFCSLEDASSIVRGLHKSPECIQIKPDSWFQGSEVPRFFDTTSHNPPLEMILWQPINSVNTVFRCNWRDGYISSMKSLSKSCKLIYLSVADSFEDLYPNTVFGIYDAGRRVRYVQSIYAENGWEFFAFGDVQPFENPHYYKKRKIKDRLNRNILVEYTLRNGLDVQSDDFWRTNIEPHYFVHGWLAGERSLLPYSPETRGQK